MSQLYLTSAANGPGTPTPDIRNLGVDLTSGRFQITASDGTALSTSNYAQVTTAVKGALGQYQTLRLEKPYKIDDDSHASIHDMEGWHPFWNTTDAWDEDRPYFLYVISHDTASSDPAIGVSQCPCYFTSPAASAINVSGTINDNTQESMFLFEISDGAGGWTTPTIANYDANPCVCIGSIRMQVTDTTNDDQTIQTLVATDGIGRYQEGVAFIAAKGTVGTYAGFFAVDPGSGGSITWTNGDCVYTIQRNGMVDMVSEWNTLTAASTNATTLIMSLPYYIRAFGGDQTLGRFVDFSASSQVTCLTSDPTVGQRTLNGGLTQHGSNATYKYNTLASSDALGIKYRYPAFRNV